MASKRVDELTNLTSMASDDLFIAYDISEPSDEKTKKISKTNAFSGLSVDGHTHSAYLPLTGGTVSGDMIVAGNLTVTGTQFIADVQTVQVTDNLILLNKNETGPGVTAGTAGLEIERGTATNYKFLFDESNDTFRVGMDGSLQAVASRQDAPVDTAFSYWNDTAKRFDTSSSYTTGTMATIAYVESTISGINGMEAHGNEYHTSAFITTTVTGSMTIQGITVGLGAGAVDSNTVFGVGALASNVTGSHLTAIGYHSLYSNTVPNNTAIGWDALYSNTEGNANTAVGVQSLRSNTTGSNNTALGMSNLYSNTTGTNNVAVGSETLTNNTTGHNNVAIGFVALQSNTDQSNNTAVGHYTLRGNTTGYENTALGNYAMGQGTITGGQNTAVGRVALTFNTSGAQNSSLGFESLGKNTTGSYNVGVGANAGAFITGGVVNNETSSNSVYIGYNTKAKTDGDTNEIVIGSGAIGDGSNTVTLGNTSITKTVLRGTVEINGAAAATQSYVDTVSGALNVAKANAVHTHDDRYYTEGEVDTISGALNSAKLDLAGGNITGNLTVGGDFTVQGENFIANTQTVLVEDNLLVINKNEVGVGVTAGQAGIEVERGSETNYQFYFDESQDNFRVGVSGSLQAVATRQDTPTVSGVAFWNNSQTRFDTASGFTVNDIATKTYLSSVFSNKYEIFTTSGTNTFTADFDLVEGAMGVYVDGVRQHNSVFTFSSPRTIILSDTVASGTALAVIAMEADAVQAMSNKVNTVVSGTTNNLTKLTASGNIADAGVSAASVIDVVNNTRRRNVIINGDTRIWQRGTATTSFGAGLGGFLADRFKVVNATDGTITYDRGTNNPPSSNLREYIWLNPTVVDASLSASQAVGLQYIIEGYDLVPLIGKTCTLSFWAYGKPAGTYCVSFSNFNTDTADRSYVAEYTLSAGASFEYKTITFTMHDLLSGSNWNTTNGGGLRIWWTCGAGSNFQTTANAWQNGNYVATSNQANIMTNITNGFGITGVQLEVGSAATQFEYRPFSEELALCQRYYQKSVAGSQAYLKGYVVNGVVYGANVQFAPYMRTTPNPLSVTRVSSLSFPTTGESVESSSSGGFVLIHTANSSSSGAFAYDWTATAEL